MVERKLTPIDSKTFEYSPSLVLAKSAGKEKQKHHYRCV